MSLTKTMDSVAAGKRITALPNIHRIENNNLKSCLKNMSSSRIITNTLWFLAQKHRVGLLMLTTLSLLGYIAYDKIGKFFI